MTSSPARKNFMHTGRNTTTPPVKPSTHNINAREVGDRARPPPRAPPPPPPTARRT